MDTDIRRELSTVADVLARAVKHHKSRDEIIAENLGAVRYSPLTIALDQALNTVSRLIDDAAA